MMLRSGILAFILVASVAGECACPPSPQKYDPASQPWFYFLGPTDNATGNACYPTNGVCTFVAETDNQTVGIQGINIPTFTSGLTLTIFDGDSTTPVFVVTNDNYTAPALVQYKSYATSMTLNLTVDPSVTEPKIYVLMVPYAGRQTTTAAPSTTTPLPTTPYTDPNIPINPYTVALDLAFAFVSGGNENPGANDNFIAMKAAIKFIADKLDITTASNNTDATRVSLQAFLKVTIPGIYGVPWELDKAGFSNALESAAAQRAMGSATWSTGIAGLTPFYDLNAASGSPPRKTAQRVYVIFTQSDPGTVPGGKDWKQLLTELAGKDVHTVVVDFRSTPSAVLNVADIPNYAYVLYDPKDPNALLNNYVTRGDSNPAFGCAPKDTFLDLSNQTQTVKFPPLYEGPLGTGSGPRYCNNQNVKITFNATDKVSCFEVTSYELEVEKDYLRIYDGDNVEQVSLTGMDVSGSRFNVAGQYPSVRFTTNANQVFGGVQFTVTKGTCPPQKP